MTTNLFKKTLIATAMTAATFSAAAVQVATTEVGISEEASLSENTIAMQDVTVTLQAEYAVGDILTFSVNGSSASAASWPNTISVAEYDDSGAADDTMTAFVDESVRRFGMTLGKLSGTADAATYRVTELTDVVTGGGSDTAETTVGNDVVLSGLELRRNQAVDAGLVRIAYSAETQTGVGVDAGGVTAGNIAVSGPEFLDSVTSADRLGANKIAIQFGRRAFANGGTDDDFVAGVTERAVAFRDARDLVGVAFDADATVTGVSFTLSGDFSFVPDITAAQNSVAVSGASNCALNYNSSASVSASKLVATGDTAGACTFDISVTDGLPGLAPEAIEPQTFSYTTVVTYDDTSGQERTKAVAENGFAGSWVLNSFSSTIGYMPFGSGISQIIYLTNFSSTEGDIFVDAWTEDGDKVLDDLNIGTTIDEGITQLSQPIRTALNEAGVTNGKVHLFIVADIPEGQGSVFSAYNVSGDRLATY